MAARPPTVTALGDLEAAVMNVVWARGKATVNDVLKALGPGRELAYTTVLTVLSRLAAKNVLTRRRDGRAFVYTPNVSRESTMRGIVEGLTRRLFQGSPVDVIAHLIEHEPDIEERELDRLEAIIRARRRGKR